MKHYLNTFKIIIFYLLTITSTVILFSTSFAMFNKNVKLQNFQINSLTQRNKIPEETQKGNLLKGQLIKFEFRSIYSRLGTIEILFDNYSRINKDQIKFRIKEKGQDKWIYEAIYDTSLIDAGQFFPFGFPILEDSRYKIYEVEIVSLNGTNKDSISLNKNSSFFKSKYFFDKKYLISKPEKVPEFLFVKGTEVLSNFNIDKTIIIHALASTPFFIFYTLFLIYLNSNLERRLKIKINYGLITILVAYFVTHLKFIDYSQFWDSEWYWQLLNSGVASIINYSGSLVGLVQLVVLKFNFLGHPSMGYVSLVSISQFIDSGNFRLLNIENIIIGTITVISFYYLVSFWFPKRKTENLLITGIFAFNPLFKR